MFRLAPCLAVGLALGSCTRSEPSHTSASIDVSTSTASSFDYAELHPIVLRAGPFVESGLSNPSAMAVVGPYVVVADQTKSDSMVKVYRASDGSLVFATGRDGEGPGEYRTIEGLQAVPSSTASNPIVSVVDVQLGRLTVVDLSPAGQKLEAAERPTFSLRAEATPTQALGKATAPSSRWGSSASSEGSRMGLC